LTVTACVMYSEGNWMDRGHASNSSRCTDRKKAPDDWVVSV
jgi:hypothetical protein